MKVGVLPLPCHARWHLALSAIAIAIAIDSLSLHS